MTPSILSSSTLVGDVVVDPDGTRLGYLKELMIDLASGSVAYAVLSRGGFGGVGERLFAIPWQLVAVDGDEERLVVDVTEEVLDDSPGFDPDDWPSFHDMLWQERVHSHFDVVPDWEGPDVGVEV